MEREGSEVAKGGNSSKGKKMKKKILVNGTRFDSKLMIILYFIYFGNFWVEKLEALVCKTHLMGRSHFGDLGSKTFWSSFDTLSGFFV